MEYEHIHYIASFGTLVLGVVAHFLKKLASMNRNGEFMTPKQYWLGHPYESSLSNIGAIVGYLMLWEMGELTLLNAFLVGYMADSVIEIAGKRQGKKIE